MRIAKHVLIACVLALGMHGHSVADPLADGQQAIVRGDYTAALSRLSPIANAGDPNAQYELGRMYQGGEGVPKDYEKAANWYRKAALQGDQHAQLLLALLYARGQGVPQDNTQGLYWLGKANEHADAAKQQGMRLLYYQALGSSNNNGTPRSAAEMTKLALPGLLKRADAGDARTQCMLSQLYATGQASPRSEAEALAWRRKCIELGYVGGAHSPPQGITMPPPH